MTLNYLKSQLGINSNYETLKGVMKDLYMSSYSQIQFIPSVPVSELLIRQTKENGVLPQNGLNLRSINQKLNIAYDFITENNMPDAMKVFKDILKYSIFFIAADKTEETRIKEIISICSEYIYLTRLNMKADELKSDKVKYAEICCIMTTCKLEVPIHKFLIYKKAKAACKVIKNFITALVFIKKMLMFESNFEQAKSEFENFQKIGTNQHNLVFNVNENLPCSKQYFCSQTFTRIDLSMKSLKCPLCQSATVATSKGQICGTCVLCTLGEEVLGLKLLENYE
jgi:hypothetical protein